MKLKRQLRFFFVRVAKEMFVHVRVNVYVHTAR